MSKLMCQSCGWSWKQRGRKPPRYCPRCKKTTWNKTGDPETTRVLILHRKLGAAIRTLVKSVESTKPQPEKDDLPM